MIEALDQGPSTWNDIVAILEHLLLQTPLFANNETLQTLLILKAMKHRKCACVQRYVNLFNNYDGPDLVDRAASWGLCREAYFVQAKIVQMRRPTTSSRTT